MMRVDEISKLAWEKKSAKVLNAAEQLLLLLLTELYSSARKGVISKDDAINRKMQIVAECEKYEKAYNEYLSVYKAYQENIKKGYTLIGSIEKAKNVFEIAAHACELVGLYTNDKNFAKRQSKKFKE
jgi:hypothetical protein